MSLFSRVAQLATLAASILGVVSPSSEVRAAELASVVLTAPSVSSIDLPEHIPVPASTEVDAPAAVETATIPADLQPGDSIAYPSLAAAVAAQSVSADADAELRCLATSVYFESKGEPLAGQLAVAQVVLNRAQAKRFGDGVCGVVTQPGQFSFVRGGQVPAIAADNAAYRTAVAVAKVALAEAWDSPAPKALYFNGRRAPFSGRVRVAAIGNHIFYR